MAEREESTTRRHSPGGNSPKRETFKMRRGSNWWEGNHPTERRGSSPTQWNTHQAASRAPRSPRRGSSKAHASRAAPRLRRTRGADPGATQASRQRNDRDRQHRSIHCQAQEALRPTRRDKAAAHLARSVGRLHKPHQDPRERSQGNRTADSRRREGRIRSHPPGTAPGRGVRASD